MPDSPTTRLGMYKSASDGSENVDYSQDIGQNLDLLDTAVGFQIVTSSTRPSSPYAGKPIAESDTSYRTYFSNGTAPASASWVQIPNSSATYSGLLAQERASAATTATQMKVTGDSQQRLTIGADGKLTWGPGNAAGDTVLYREAASVLTTDDILRVYRSTSGENAISLRVTGDANSRLYINASGEMNWGPGGASSTDVTLARSSSGTLTLTGALTVTGTASAQTETTTSGATAATDFTVTSFSGRRTCGVATVSVALSYSGSTSTADSAGNIGDKLAVTLPSGWRPAATMVEAFDKSGTAMGDVLILNDGTCTLKTLSPNASLASGNTVTFSATYVL